jgi:hypothetical protein
MPGLRAPGAATEQRGRDDGADGHGRELNPRRDESHSEHSFLLFGFLDFAEPTVEKT